MGIVGTDIVPSRAANRRMVRVANGLVFQDHFLYENGRLADLAGVPWRHIWDPAYPSQAYIAGHRLFFKNTGGGGGTNPYGAWFFRVVCDAFVPRRDMAVQWVFRRIRDYPTGQYSEANVGVRFLEYSGDMYRADSNGRVFRSRITGSDDANVGSLPWTQDQPRNRYENYSRWGIRKIDLSGQRMHYYYWEVDDNEVDPPTGGYTLVHRGFGYDPGYAALEDKLGTLVLMDTAGAMVPQRSEFASVIVCASNEVTVGNLGVGERIRCGNAVSPSAVGGVATLDLGGAMFPCAIDVLTASGSVRQSAAGVYGGDAWIAG